MPRLTEQEQQEIVRFIEADRPLPEECRLLLFEDNREVKNETVTTSGLRLTCNVGREKK